MKFSKYLILSLALFGQLEYAREEVIFKNNSGVFIVLEMQTHSDAPETYSKIFPLGVESQQTEKFTNFIIPGAEPARALERQINRLRIKYGNSASASSSLSGYYPVDTDKIKAGIRNCRNGNFIVEIQRPGWLAKEAPITTYCSEDLSEESFTMIAPNEAELLQRAKNPYRILNIDQNASESAINKAWRTMTLKWHPDKVPADKQREATIVIKIINDAREKTLRALTDPRFKQTLLNEQ